MKGISHAHSHSNSITGSSETKICANLDEKMSDIMWRFKISLMVEKQGGDVSRNATKIQKYHKELKCTLIVQYDPG
jgi:hypothetical protein